MLAPLESRVRVRRLARGATLIALGQPTPALFGVLGGLVETRISSAAGQVSVVEQRGARARVRVSRRS